ncbi:MAG: hypothetical protein R2799_16035 [Crocinitomicaceae bacterium]
MLSKLLFRNRKKLSLYISFIGAILGINFLLLTTEVFQRLKNILEAEEVMGENTVMIHKIVSEQHLIGLGSTDFSEKEIKELQNKDFLTKVSPVKLNLFSASIGLHESMEGTIPYFRTDTYLNAVADEFIDTDRSQWHWDEKSEFVPVIMPKVYMTMLNHGFAQSYGMPKISEGIAKSILFKIEIDYQGKTYKFTGRLVGFSQSINAILVPESFMDFCNERYAIKEKINPSQLMVQFNEGSYGKFADLLKDKRMEIQKSQFDLAKIKSILNIVIYFIGIEALLIIILAINGIMLYSELVITRALYEIRTLLRIGYGINAILMRFILFFFLRFLLIVIFANALVYAEFAYLRPHLESIGMHMDYSISELSIMISVSILIGMVILNYIGTRITLVRTGKEKS